MARTGPLRIVLAGHGETSIKPSDHIATGGEASVYRLGNSRVVKIYTDPNKAQRDGTVDKVKALSVIRHDSIIAPQGLVTDRRGTPIGCFMPLAQGDAMSRAFTNDFRARTGFDDQGALKLCARMRDAVSAAHGFGAIMCDANELNWLADTAKGIPYVIDVDSWAIDRWKASVIMPSIRDWHANGRFDEMTDWFAWGVVTFQLWTGIHPYKGRLDGYKPGEMERRMKDNASVFSAGVRLNRAVRDINHIPDALRSWYEATFQHGERSAPPDQFAAATLLPPAQTTLRARTTTGQAGKLLNHERLFDGTANAAVRVYPCGAVLTKKSTLVDLGSGNVITMARSPNAEVIRVDGGWLLADVINGASWLRFISASNRHENDMGFSVSCQNLFRYDNRLFTVNQDKLSELEIVNIGKTPLVTAGGRSWTVLPHATQWFDGVGVQDTLGSMFLMLPYGDKAMAQLRVPELDGLEVIDAKAGRRFVALSCLDRQGTAQRIELSLGKDYQSYSLWRGQNDQAELNMAILPKGVCATIVEDGRLDIFVPSTGAHNPVTDTSIDSSMRLANWGDRVVYIDGSGSVWSVALV